MAERFAQKNIPHLLMKDKVGKMAYDPAADKVTLVTMHSSKGLEFSHVIIIGVGKLSDKEEDLQDEARLLYVGMTRAQRKLLLTTSKDNRHSRQLLEIASARVGTTGA